MSVSYFKYKLLSLQTISDQYNAFLLDTEEEVMSDQSDYQI